MESLALAAAVIVLTIVLLGGVSLVAAVRPPRRQSLRIVVSIPAAGAVIAGAWLASIEIGIGGRFIGAVVAGSGLSALIRTWRRR